MSAQLMRVLGQIMLDRMDDSKIREVFARLLTKADLAQRNLHFLRHTFASLLIQQRESLAYVKEQMGHSSIAITVDTYDLLVPGGKWSHPADSNRRPTDYESVALPTELGWPVRKIADLRGLIQAMMGSL